MAPLRHNGIVEMYGASWEQGVGSLCIVLELCDQGSLGSVLWEDMHSANTCLTWEHPLYQIIIGISEAMRYLHMDLTQPLMHRDLKPDNVLIAAGWVPKIADFGTSKRFDKRLLPSHGEERVGEDYDNNDCVLTMTVVGSPMPVTLPSYLSSFGVLLLARSCVVHMTLAHPLLCVP